MTLVVRSRQLLLGRSTQIRSLAYKRTVPNLSEMNDEIKPDSASVSTEIKLKNAALATTLVAFCFGVAWYSTYAVGQAGGGAEDPLAALRNEAAAAKEKQDRETRQASDANDLLKQFQSGGYDPDQYDEEQESNSKKSNRPWYKFW
jgi:hypothetical protein